MDFQSVEFNLLRQEVLSLCVPVDSRWTEDDIVEVKSTLCRKHLEFKSISVALQHRLKSEGAYIDVIIVRETTGLTTDEMCLALQSYSRRQASLRGCTNIPVFPLLIRLSSFASAVALEQQCAEEEAEASDDEGVDAIYYESPQMLAPTLSVREVPQESSSQELYPETSSEIPFALWEEHCPEELQLPLPELSEQAQTSLESVPDVVPSWPPEQLCYVEDQETVPCRVQEAVTLHFSGIRESVCNDTYPREFWVDEASSAHCSSELAKLTIRVKPHVGESCYPRAWLACVKEGRVRPPEVFLMDAVWTPLVDEGLARLPKLLMADAGWNSSIKEGRTRPPEIRSWY